MTSKSEVLDRIRRAFSIWATDIKQSSKVNRLADNISSEDIAAGLLNLIYDYHLRNANEDRSNQKAIDLADSDAEDEAGVAVQISSTNSRPKAIKTMTSFCEGSFGQRLCDKYSKLIFLIISTEEKFKDWDKLSSDDFTLSILNLMDLSKYIEHFPLEKLEQILEHLQRELKLESGKPDDCRQNITRIATILDTAAIADACEHFSEQDVDQFYMVDLNFPLMLRVVSKDRDVSHREMDDRLRELCDVGTPVILTGHSGTGKSTIMLRTAVSWVRGGGIALWLSLPDDAKLTDAEATRFYEDVLRILSADQRALLCLDNPSQWSEAFSTLARNWPGDSRLQLLLAERTNRLSRLTDPNSDLLHHWFDGAVVAAMMPDNQNNPLRVKDFAVEYIPDTYQRKMAILNKAVSVMIRRGVVRAISQSDAVRQIMKDYHKANVSLVELIYRAQFKLRDYASKPEQLRLDWDEWKQILRKELGINKKSAQQLYGVIALCNAFQVPVSISLFCRFFDLSPLDLEEAIHKWRMSKNVEPVILQKRNGSSVLLPKHDVVADLFFLFHRDTLPVNTLMLEILETMNEFEIEAFLEENVRKTPIRKGYQFPLGQIRYWDYLTAIYRRTRNGTCGLSPEGYARLGLGLLYAVPDKDRTLALEMVASIAPGLDGSVLPASLYTEWGRMLATLKQYKAAEEKFRAVICADSRNIHSRTELGRLLAKQPGRESEAEQFLRDTIKIKPDDIQSRTELGRLLAKQPGRESEAELLLREAMQIDPKHIQSRTELGRLLAKQPGRESEAELFLREILAIDHNNIQARTELGRLLAKQPGRESEAELFLREAIRIDPKNLHPHTELGRLLAKQHGREAEAELFLREAIRIDPENLHPHTELGRLLARQPGRETEAEKFLREILTIDHNNIQARTEIAKLYVNQGKFDEAESLYREVLQIKPTDSYAKNGLAKLRQHRESPTA